MTSVSFTIDAPRHQRRCRAALEQYQDLGPTLPLLGDRPRHYTDTRGRSFAWVNSLGRYIAID